MDGCCVPGLINVCYCVSMETAVWPRRFYRNTFMPPSLWNLKRKSVEEQTRACTGMPNVCTPSSVVGKLGNRSERSQPSLPHSPEASLTCANFPTSLQYCLLHIYTPRLSAPPYVCPRLRPRGGPSLSLSPLGLLGSSSSQHRWTPELVL